MIRRECGNISKTEKVASICVDYGWQTFTEALIDRDDEMKRIFIIPLYFIFSIILGVNFSAYAETKNTSNECVEDVVDLSMEPITEQETKSEMQYLFVRFI